MPSMTTIALADREATPVTHTFQPSTPQNGVARLVNGISGIPVGNESLTVSTRPSGRRIKTKMVLTMPVVQTETISGVSKPVVVRVAYAEVVFTVEDTSSLQERKNLVGLTYAALASGQVTMNDVFTNLNPLY